MTGRKRPSQGFALLYAVLVASVISITGLLLSDIIFKQLVLSSIGKESQFAYYAATAGQECASFWDNQGAFGAVIGTGGEGFEYDGSTIINPIECDNKSIIVGWDDQGPKAVNVFEFTMTSIAGSPSGSCSTVTVRKDPTVESNNKTTFFTSRGYNRGGADCDEPHPRRVEKTIFRSPSPI